MFINGIGTAAPGQRYSKNECWEAFLASEWFARLGPRAHALARHVLCRDNGIAFRHLAVDSLQQVFQIDPDTLQARYQGNAPALAANAAMSAMEQAQLRTEQIDAVIVSSCTGYLCPGLSGYVIEQLGLRKDSQAFDLVGQGCGAALPNLRLASALLASGHCRHVLSVCVEVSSAAMYLDEDPGVLVSACLFGDGAGAMVLSRCPKEHVRRVEWLHAESMIEPGERDLLKFEQRAGLLRNILTRDVPALAARYAVRVLDQALQHAPAAREDITAWIVHPGGRDVLQALQKQLGLPPDALRHSATVLREYGNLSSASVYFVMQEAMRNDAPPGKWWLSAFGAGFSCHGALLAVS